MNLSKFTEKAQEAILTGQQLAAERTNAEVTPEHLLVALVEQQGGIVPSILRRLNIDPARVASEGAELLRGLPQQHGGEDRKSTRLNSSHT